MAGKVTFEDVKGEEVIGATVVAVHEPSGSRYTAVTNASGNFTIQGMRTGGPYEVTISYIGYQPKVVKGITLELAETYNLNVWLSEDANVLTEVVVSGKASKFAAEKTGAATNINNAMISNLPTVNRNITDVVRLSPYGQGGGGMGLGGGGVQFNGILSTSIEYFLPSQRIASGKVIFSAFIRNCTGPPLASQTKQR